MTFYETVKFAADENFNNDIIRGLLRRKPELAIMGFQDAGLSGANDPAVLEWAALKKFIFSKNQHQPFNYNMS